MTRDSRGPGRPPPSPGGGGPPAGQPAGIMLSDLPGLVVRRVAARRGSGRGALTVLMLTRL